MFFSNITNKFMQNKVVNVTILFWKRCKSHDMVGMSAKTAYYLLLSFFPLTLLLLSVSAGHDMQIFEHIMPPSVLGVIERVPPLPKGELTTVSLILLIWSASTSIRAFMSGIYVAHTGFTHERQKRGRLWALVFTILLMLAVFLCVSLTLLSGIAVNWLSFHFSWLSRTVLYNIRLLIMTGLIFAFAVSLYVVTPGDKMRIRDISLGAALASVGWVIATWGFETYMRMFNNYALLYGGVGVFLGLALWLFIVTIDLFIGAEINAYRYERKNKVV